MWTLVNYILGTVILDVVISFILATIITIVYMAFLIDVNKQERKKHE